MITKLLKLSGIFLIFFALHAQASDTIPKYPFINYSADTLIFDPDSTNLNHFFEKYNQMIQSEKGHINILHIGGSHVQAGTFPHTIRQHILFANPNLIASRGMIFPYSAAPRSNNPQDYQVRSKGSFQIVRNVFAEHAVPLGVTGVAVITSDTLAELKIIFKDTLLQFKTNQIILLGYADSSAIIPTIWIDSTEYYPISYDSIKKRYLFETKQFTDSFTLKINNSNGERFIINGFYLGNSSDGITYNSIGVNGANTNSYLRCQNFVQDLDLINPDLVIFGIGINDAFAPNFNPEEFKQNYLALVNIIKEKNPNCSFIFVTNNDSFKKTKVKVKKKRKVKWINNENVLDVQQVMYDLAEITHGAVFDQFEIMGGQKSMAKWFEYKLAQKDRVHFTRAGYVLMGNLFYNAFDDAFQKINSKKTNLSE